MEYYLTKFLMDFNLFKKSERVIMLMKRFLFLVLIGFFAFNISLSQYENELQKTHFTLFGGLMLPQGDFGNTNGEKAGYAKIGLGAEFEVNYMYDPIIYWTTSATISVNSIDEDVLAKQMSEIFPSNVSVSAGDYTLIWALTGLNLETKTPSGVIIYGNGKVGILFSSFPNIKILLGGTTINQTTEMGIALAIGLGAGVKINKLNLGIRYYTGEPNYKQKANFGGIESTAKVKLPATLLSLVVGYNF